jgi:hypothetical protein
MPPLPKPGFKPEWATIIGVYGGKTNAIEPAAGLKPEGWKHTEKPPRNTMNWLHHYTGEWIDYLESATDAGKMPATKVVAAVNASDQWRQTADLVLQAADNQAALISALIVTVGAGGRVLFSDGLFELTEPIEVANNYTILQGQGPATIFRNLASVGNECFAVHFDGTESGRLLDCRIDASSASGAVFANGVHLDGAERTIINRVLIWGMFGGPSVHGAPNIPQGVGIFAENSTGIISNCNIMPTSSPASQSAENIWAINSTLVIDVVDMLNPLWGGGSVAPTAAGICFETGKARISNCQIDHMNVGISLTGCSNSLVDACYIHDLVADGIDLDICDQTYLVDNDIDGAPVNGVHIRSTCSSCSLSGGQIQTALTGVLVSAHGCNISTVDMEAVDVGIYVFVGGGTVEKTKISNCRIQTTGGAGSKCIYASAASVSTTIQGGYFSIAEVGLEDFGLKTSIGGGAKFELCTAANIRSDETAAYGTFSNCIHEAGATHCIDMQCSRANVSGNTLMGADHSLIIVRVNGDYNSIIGNVAPVMASCQYGINQDGIHAAKNYIQSNYLYNCGTVADLRVQNALNAAASTPETNGGMADGHSVHDNNYLLTSVV